MVILAEFHAPESPIVHEQCNTRAIFNSKDLGLGTVYVSERTLCWKDQANRGFSIEYPHVCLHARSTDPTILDRECLYIMIDKRCDIFGGGEEAPMDAPVSNSDDEDESSSSSGPDISELLFIPSDTHAIGLIYHALSHCQSLNPDPDDMMSDVEEGEEEENVYEDAESERSARDIAAGGDTEVNRLSARFQSHSVSDDCRHGTSNGGDQNFDNGDDDDQFEDAD